MKHSSALSPESEAFDADAHDESGPVSVCAEGRRKLMELSGLAGGALFVLVPNSELIHSGLRALLGFGGYECC